jgi:N-acetylneuraminate synthase
MKTYIIAEVGSVHDGSFGNAKCLIETAAECGADAVKFQTHIAAAETLRDAPMPPYFTGEPRYSYFERTGFQLDQWLLLKEHCLRHGIEFLSSPFSEEAVDLLEQVGMERWKIPSGEVTNLPLLDRIGRTGKPVLLSSGMNSWSELDRAVAAVRRHHDRLTVLQCTSEYPCPYDHVGINVMVEMARRYGLPVGLSDHTLTIYAPLLAVAHGASVIEKHFTLSRRMYGSDARHSQEPGEFAEMVRGIRAIETMLASRVEKDDLARFASMKEIFQKSLVAKRDMPAGTVLTADLIAIKKPGTGIPAARWHEVIGLRTARSVRADSLLVPEDIDWQSGQQPSRRAG